MASEEDQDVRELRQVLLLLHAKVVDLLASGSWLRSGMAATASSQRLGTDHLQAAVVRLVHLVLLVEFHGMGGLLDHWDRLEEEDHRQVSFPWVMHSDRAVARIEDFPADQDHQTADEVVAIHPYWVVLLVGRQMKGVAGH